MSTRIVRPRAAAKQARSAQYWGDRRREAEQAGPEAEFAAAVDHLRSMLRRIPGDQKAAVLAEAVRALDSVRQSLAEN